MWELVAFYDLPTTFFFCFRRAERQREGNVKEKKEKILGVFSVMSAGSTSLVSFFSGGNPRAFFPLSTFCSPLPLPLHLPLLPGSGRPRPTAIPSIHLSIPTLAPCYARRFWSRAVIIFFRRGFFGFLLCVCSPCLFCCFPPLGTAYREAAMVRYTAHHHHRRRRYHHHHFFFYCAVAGVIYPLFFIFFFLSSLPTFSWAGFLFGKLFVGVMVTGNGELGPPKK